MLEARLVSKTFEGNKVLKNISFRVGEGEFTAVMGRSGCGKSTLLYCVSGMDRPTSGDVVFQSRPLNTLSEKETERMRLCHMGFIFQKANFLKNLSVEDNIIFPAFQAALRPRREIVKEAEDLMGRLGILSVASQDIRKVSGGQLQRAAICRAMINHPDILFGDEPTGALNSSATKDVMDILVQINKAGTAVLLVTHDAKVAARADRVIYLDDGSVKSEFRNGKYSAEKEQEREKNINEWLVKMRF